MKSRLLIGLSAAAVMLNHVATAAPASDDDAKVTLESAYQQLHEAMAAHDHRALSALLASDFTSIDADGKAESAEQMMTEVDAVAPDPDRTSNTIIESIKLDGDSAIVSQRYDMTTMRRGPTGADQRVELVTNSTDTWVRDGYVWLLRETRTGSLDYFLNGRLAAHKGASGHP